jgi:hypothetical protein
VIRRTNVKKEEKSNKLMRREKAKKGIKMGKKIKRKEK